MKKRLGLLLTLAASHATALIPAPTPPIHVVPVVSPAQPAVILPAGGPCVAPDEHGGAECQIDAPVLSKEQEAANRRRERDMNPIEDNPVNMPLIGVPQ